VATLAAMSGKRVVLCLLPALTAACGDQNAGAKPRAATIAGSAQPSASDPAGYRACKAGDEFLKFGKRAPGIDGQKYLEIYRQCDMASYKW
jgi:hypothetical protein